jgi:hypothetical protein
VLTVIWTGVVVLLVKSDHPSRGEGYLGGYAAVACEAATLHQAVQSIEIEFDGHALEMVGIENFMPTHMRDRQLTEEEQQLVQALHSYPVQFQDVHLHKGDG